MATAASDFLDGLDAAQRRTAAWPFPSDDERQLWFYTPTDHGGVALGDLRPLEQQAAMKLVASGLSRAGYVTVATIVGLDNILDALEGWSAVFDRERGRDPGRYYLRVFGHPKADRTWGWRFGGHHVSINHTVVDGRVAAVTPCFLGADPANAPLLGPHPLRPLGGAEDLGRELVQALDPGQLDRALLSPVAPLDLATANRSAVSDGDGPLPLPAIWRKPFEGEIGRRLANVQSQAEERAGLRTEHIDAVRYTSAPKGLRAADMSPKQQDWLRALLDVYLRRIPDAIADHEVAKYDGDRLHGLHFAWAGSIHPHEPHYYRVQGPRLLLEYDNTQRNVNHVHTVWRDPDGDFAFDVLRAHRQAVH